MQSSANQPISIAYADETQYNVGRYRGLAVISLRLEDAITLSTEIHLHLGSSGVSEFKWVDLWTARQRFAAGKLLYLTFQAVCLGTMRVDVLTWDVEAPHHPTPGQSGVATLQQMYLLLLGTALRRHQTAAGFWRICPDEQSALDWVGLAAELKIQGLAIEQIVPCHSHEEPLVQVADLCAGLAVYSRSAYDRFEAWQQVAGISPELLHPEEGPEPPTGSDRERYKVLADLLALCTTHQLPVLLQGEQGLTTTDPATPITFWAYEPPVQEEQARRDARAG